QDGMAMIKSIEKLRELECVLGQVGGFGRGNALVNNVGSLRSCQPEFPNFVAVFAGEISCEFAGGKGGGRVSAELVWIKAALAEDVGGSNYRILGVWSGLTFEAQRFFEIECDHRRLGELQHEIAQSTDGDLCGNSGTLGFGQLRMARIDFALRRRDESIKQVIGLNPKSLAARDFNVGTAL